MAIVAKESIIERVKGLYGESVPDEGITLIEDISDSFDGNLSAETPDLESMRADYEARLAELDKTWREKYLARFTEGQLPAADVTTETLENPASVEVEEETPMTYEDLFTEEV